eukprot:7730860-Pyramimonas_sp.AAC.1
MSLSQRRSESASAPSVAAAGGGGRHDNKHLPTKLVAVITSESGARKSDACAALAVSGQCKV